MVAPILLAAVAVTILTLSSPHVLSGWQAKKEDMEDSYGI